MTGQITITLDDGSILTGQVTLTPKNGAAPSQLISPGQDGPNTLKLESKDDLDFSLPVRPFMNEYAGELSGSKKFALLVAHFAKGELDVLVERTEVVETWNKMTGLLGGKFNGAHESRAKDSGYIYVPESGKVALLKKWRQALA